MSSATAPGAPRIALRSYAAPGAAHSHAFAQVVLPLHGTMDLRLMPAGPAGTSGTSGAWAGTALSAPSAAAHTVRHGAVQAGQGVLIPAHQAHTFGAVGANRFVVLDFDCAVDEGSFFACDAALEHLLRYLHTLDGPGAAAPHLLAHAAVLLGEAVQGRIGPGGRVPAARPAMSTRPAMGVVPPAQPASPATAPAVSPAIARALARMRQGLAEPLRVADLARAAGLSTSHLQAEFRRQVGESPARHLARLRLQAAQAQLCGSDRSIAQIALACGYSEQSALNRALRRQLGTTPLAMRRSRLG